MAGITDPEPYPQPKSRHGCATAWLVVMIVASAAVVVVYVGMLSQPDRLPPDFPTWLLPVMIVLGVFNILCAFALFAWKKIGFYGLCLSAFLATIGNLAAGLGAGAGGGLLGILLLYGLLQLGGPRSTWSQLE